MFVDFGVSVVFQLTGYSFRKKQVSRTKISMTAYGTHIFNLHSRGPIIITILSQTNPIPGDFTYFRTYSYFPPICAYTALKFSFL